MTRIFFVILLSWLVYAEQDEEGGKCERIKLPLCQDLGYNWTAMPNLMGHKDQKEAEEAVRLFINYYKVLTVIRTDICQSLVTLNIEKCYFINLIK